MALPRRCTLLPRLSHDLAAAARPVAIASASETRATHPLGCHRRLSSGNRLGRDALPPAPRRNERLATPHRAGIWLRHSHRQRNSSIPAQTPIVCHPRNPHRAQHRISGQRRTLPRRLQRCTGSVLVQIRLVRHPLPRLANRCRNRLAVL